LTLTVHTGFSQNARVIIDSDTLYMVPVKNLRRANVMFIERDYFAMQNKTLQDKTIKLTGLVTLYKEQVQQADSVGMFYKLAYQTEGEALFVANQTIESLAVQLRRRNLVLTGTALGLVICLTKIIFTL